MKQDWLNELGLSGFGALKGLNAMCCLVLS
jgi:hypothetical protein